ncbi:MAG TPA: GxxExxY protein [Ignavibacteriaceae bacterium]|nr:GxxExxY protein [Ignavibacteriaceae bacterium]
MVDLIHKEEVFKIIGICMEVHRRLGKGFLEIVYKDAIEYECKQKDIYYELEKEFLIHYKYVILPHKFFADFVLFNKIILEVKCCRGLVDEFMAQTLNYLAALKFRVGLIVNFGKESLEYKRIVL